MTSAIVQHQPIAQHIHRFTLFQWKQSYKTLLCQGRNQSTSRVATEALITHCQTYFVNLLSFNCLTLNVCFPNKHIFCRQQITAIMASVTDAKFDAPSMKQILLQYLCQKTSVRIQQEDQFIVKQLKFTKEQEKNVTC